MKNLAWMIVLLLTVNVAMAQESAKDSYTLNGDQIDAVLYHDNGVVAQKGSYTKAGKLDGKWLSFDTNGTLTAEAFYNEGEKVGTWTFYNGDTKKVVTYTDSRIGEVATWKLTDSRVVSN